MIAYLINLDRASDRRDYMIEELSRLLPNMPVERAMCIDIKSADWVRPSFVQSGRWKSDRWSLGPSDIEIFRSHIDCWQKIAASGETGLVLEDDLLFSKKFGHAIKQLETAQLQGIVHLDGTGQPLILRNATTHLIDFSLCPVGTITASAAAYILNPKTAATLIENAKIERTVDDYLFDPTPSDRGTDGHGLPIFQLEPIVTIQAQFGTFADPVRLVPEFIKATKRVDANKRRDPKIIGPRLYRLRKEMLRALYRHRLAQRKRSTISKGGRWAVPELCYDLRWRSPDPVAYHEDLQRIRDQ